MNPQIRRIHTGGFTLIELLLGAVISAILLSALYGIFHGILQEQAHAYAGLEDMAPRDQVIRILKHDLTNMVIPNGIFCGSMLGETSGENAGRADTLEFYTTSGRTSSEKPWGEIQKVEYYLDTENQESKDSGARLIRSVTRNLLPATSDDQSNPTVLLEGVNTLEFQYYSEDEWIDSWDSTSMDNALPTAIRVRIEFVEQNKKQSSMEPIELMYEITAQSPAASTSASGGT